MSDKNVKRNLPSWMSSTDDYIKSDGRRANDSSENGESRKVKNPKHVTPSKETESSKNSTLSFSKLLEGVVLVLSGFVNPERGTLRSQALAMGAEYKGDWSLDCTLLVCAFPNTPKFRQVEADCGTIVSKEWISDCYTQKKLVEIDSYLMNAGKPWRKGNVSVCVSEDQEASLRKKSEKQVERGSHPKTTTSISSKDNASNPAKNSFSPSTLKKWAIDDLNRTISWLESQEEKPEPSEIKKIAAEGILVCLQDAVDSLEQKQDVRVITEQWSFIPRAVEELVKLEGTINGSASLTKEDLYRHAKVCKKIYENELKNLDGDPTTKNKKPNTLENRIGKERAKAVCRDAEGYDSDDTIEMTEEEIDMAYKTMAYISKNGT